MLKKSLFLRKTYKDPPLYLGYKSSIGVKVKEKCLDYIKKNVRDKNIDGMEFTPCFNGRSATLQWEGLH